MRRESRPSSVSARAEEIPEHDVHVSERNRAGEHDRPAGAKDIAIALKHESPKDDTLRINGEDGISDHHDAPEKRALAREIEEEGKPEAQDEHDPDHNREREQAQYSGKV